MAGKYKRIRIIGSGTFGKAWLVKSVTSQRCYVVKEVLVTGMDDKERSQAINEITILSRLKHKNVIRYREAFVENGCLNIAMEYADKGDLAEKLKARKVSSEGGFRLNETMDIFVQICFALSYIHAQKILHRDLKPANIFLTSSKLVKLGDFGIARKLRHSLDQAITAIGTPYYISPEICRKQPYNQKSDMWAVGCILYEMITLQHPFEAADFPSLVIKIMKGQYIPIDGSHGPLLEDLVSVLLRVNPTRRPTSSQILNIPTVHPFVERYMVRVQSDSSTCNNNHTYRSPHEKTKSCASPSQHSLITCKHSSCASPDTELVNVKSFCAKEGKENSQVNSTEHKQIQVKNNKRNSEGHKRNDDRRITSYQEQKRKEKDSAPPIDSNINDQTSPTVNGKVKSKSKETYIIYRSDNQYRLQDESKSINLVKSRVADSSHSNTGLGKNKSKDLHRDIFETVIDCKVPERENKRMHKNAKRSVGDEQRYNGDRKRGSVNDTDVYELLCKNKNEGKGCKSQEKAGIFTFDIETVRKYAEEKRFERVPKEIIKDKGVHLHEKQHNMSPTQQTRRTSQNLKEKQNTPKILRKPATSDALNVSADKLIEVAEMMHAVTPDKIDSTQCVRSKLESLRLYLEHRLGTSCCVDALKCLDPQGKGKTEEVVKKIRKRIGSNNMVYFPMLLQIRDLEQRSE